MPENVSESILPLIISSAVKRVVSGFRDNRKFLKKPMYSMIRMAFLTPPWSLKLKDGDQKSIKDYDEFFRERFKYLHKDSYLDDTSGHYILKTGKDGKLVKLKLLNNGDIFRAFVNEDYSWLPVDDQIVLDVGCSIGDSSIFFAIEGAKKVYAYEPFLYSFRMAKFNVEQNGYGSIIEVINEAVGNSGEVSIDPNFISTNSSKLLAHTSSNGHKIKVRSLKELVEKIGSSTIVMKMDCEGCEYDAILKESCETLRRFRYIQMEYHHGYLNIKRKL